MIAPQIRMLPDGRRLHLQHGPIDLIVGADGDPAAIRAAFSRAADRFATILDELCAELPHLRAPVREGSPRPTGIVAARMYDAVAPFAAETFVTPMAAVAGAVAEEVLGAMAAWLARPHHEVPASRASKDDPEISEALLRGSAFGRAPQDEGRGSANPPGLTRAYVNNGGDIALHLAPGESFRIGLVDRPDRPSLLGTTEIAAADGIRGIATSGWRGRSFSRGIADAVTVLAARAAQADAAASIIANAVDLPGHPAIRRQRACDIQPDSDLGDRLVTRDVGPLTAREIEAALARGIACAEALVARRLIRGASLHCAGTTRICAGMTRVVGGPRPIATPARRAVPRRSSKSPVSEGSHREARHEHV